MKIKEVVEEIKESVKEQVEQYKSLSIIRPRETKLKTTLATIFYILSFIALIPSFLHIAFDIMIHGPAVATSFSLFQMSEAI